jgi:hypothetical protein
MPISGKKYIKRESLLSDPIKKYGIFRMPNCKNKILNFSNFDF